MEFKKNEEQLKRKTVPDILYKHEDYIEVESTTVDEEFDNILQNAYTCK